MNIFPAIDLYDGKVVRLYKGSYNDMTVYSDDPVSVAKDFEAHGAEYIHVVDLMGAKEGKLCAYETVSRIISSTDLKLEIGGGIRTEEAIKAYTDAGVDKVIIGTAAVNNHEFMSTMSQLYSKKLAVGIDVKNGFVAVKGWTETANVTLDEMFSYVSSLGIDRVICTDISKDGAMMGTNLSMYATLSNSYKMNIVASGGVSSLDDVCALSKMNLYGAIIGKAYYTGAIDLSQAIRISKNDN